ncbi:MAG: rhodanese-like domain-containing protein [Anaerolineae bacterium]
MRNKIWLVIGVLAMLALTVAACGSASPGAEDSEMASGDLTKNSDGYVDISVEQLADMLEDKDFTLVNVHIPYEGEIPQTDQFIPYDEIVAYQDQLPDKDATIVLYCRSGSMSTSAAKELVELGYSNVLEVDGGFNAWAAAGYELLHKE